MIICSSPAVWTKIARKNILKQSAIALFYPEWSRCAFSRVATEVSAGAASTVPAGGVVMSDVMTSFATFGNFTGSWNGLQTTSTFVVPPGGISVGQVIKIPHTTAGVAAVDSVTVTQVTSTSFTFATNPGHPLDGTITFTASQQSSEFVGFSKDIHGKTASGFWSIFFAAGGGVFEDDVWNHFLGSS